MPGLARSSTFSTAVPSPPTAITSSLVANSTGAPSSPSSLSSSGSRVLAAA